MHKFLFAAVVSAILAAPAAAQPSPLFDERMDDEIVRAIPPAEQVEAMAPALDLSVGALLNMDVGPILDAADPYRRRPGYGRPGRTLAELGRRDDPYFEQRLRSSIYGATSDVARMMDSLAVAAPALRRSLGELERGMAAAIDDYHARRGVPRPYRDDEPFYDED